jgi:hypothetical protein
MSASVFTDVPNIQLLRAMQATVARDGITPSALRRSSPGTIAAVRTFLADLSLADFAAEAESDFTTAHAVA